MCVNTISVQMIRDSYGEEKRFFLSRISAAKTRKSASRAFPDTPAKTAKSSKPPRYVIVFHPRLRRPPVILRYRRSFRSMAICFHRFRLPRTSFAPTTFATDSDEFLSTGISPADRNVGRRNRERTIVYSVRVKYENPTE